MTKDDLKSKMPVLLKNGEIAVVLEGILLLKSGRAVSLSSYRNFNNMELHTSGWYGHGAIPMP